MGKSPDVLLRYTLPYHVLISECTIAGFPTRSHKSTFCLAGFWPVCDPIVKVVAKSKLELHSS